MSSQRASASAWKTSASSISSQAMSPLDSAAAFSRVTSCSARTVATRCRCTTAATSATPDRIANTSLMASSWRGITSRGTGVSNHRPSSSRPASVISYTFWPSASASAVTSPSRSRRPRVVYTCPTLSGQTSPVAASNSVFSP